MDYRVSLISGRWKLCGQVVCNIGMEPAELGTHKSVVADYWPMRRCPMIQRATRIRKMIWSYKISVRGGRLNWS